MKRKFIFLLCMNDFIFSGVDLQKRKDTMKKFYIRKKDHEELVEDYVGIKEILAERDNCTSSEFKISKNFIRQFNVIEYDEGLVGHHVGVPILDEQDNSSSSEVTIGKNLYAIMEISLNVVNRMKELYDYLIENQNIESEISDEMFLEAVKKYDENRRKLPGLNSCFNYYLFTESPTDELVIDSTRNYSV